ncbi:K02A2.6-like, partial [Cordylochernes scorpioides]
MKGTKTYNSNFPKNPQGWSSNEKRKCFRCGYYQGHSKEQCPAKDAICNKCRKKGHFAKVCHTKTVQEVSSSQNYAFIGIVGMQENAEDKWCEVIKVNDQPIKFKIDTGAEVLVMPEGIYLQHFGYLKTEKADKNLFAVSKKIEICPQLSGDSASNEQVTVKERRMDLGDDQDRAFDQIKKNLTSAQGLSLYDPSLPITVSADASSFGLGAVIWQTKDGLRQVIAYASRTLSETEKRYAQIKKEALAITWACEKFKQYIQGLVITLETDHKPLVPIFTSKNIDDLTPRIQRLRLRIMRYSYKIVHTPGKNLIVADALSRSPRTKVGTQELEEELCAYVQQVVSFMPISDVRVKEIKESQDKDQKELASQRIHIWLCWPIELHHLRMASAQQNLAWDGGFAPLFQHQPPNLKNLKNQETIQREKQKYYFDRAKGVRELPPLDVNDRVWLTDLKTPGVIISKADTPRSYVVDTPRGSVRRNRFHLLPTGQRSPGPPHFEPDEEPYINCPEANTHTSDAPTDVTDSSTSPKEALYRTRCGRTNVTYVTKNNARPRRNSSHDWQLSLYLGLGAEKQHLESPDVLGPNLSDITEPPKKLESICGTDISSRGGCILEVRPLLPGTDLGWHMLPFQICRLPLGIAGIVGISGIRQLELNFSHSGEITSDLMGDSKELRNAEFRTSLIAEPSDIMLPAIPISEIKTEKYILSAFPHCFCNEIEDMGGGSTIIAPKLTLKTDKPVYRAQYPIPNNLLPQVKDLVDKLTKGGIVERSTSLWNSPLFPVVKSDGSVRITLDLRRNGRKFLWESVHQEAFDQVKARLTSFPILVHPYPNKSYLLYTDASGIAVGACLCQEEDGATTPNQKSETVARILISDVISHYGVPKTILSDRGSVFMSRVFKSCCYTLGVEAVHTTAWRPQSNVAAERLNRTVIESLRKCASGSSWDELLPLVAMSIRSTLHASTGYSPAKLLYGYEMRLPELLGSDMDFPIPEGPYKVIRRAGLTVYLLEDMTTKARDKYHIDRIKLYHQPIAILKGPQEEPEDDPDEPVLLTPAWVNHYHPPYLNSHTERNQGQEATTRVEVQEPSELRRSTR